MRAGTRMREEDTDLFGDLWTQRVLNPQSMLVHRVIIDVEGIMKQALGEAVAAESLPRARLSEVSKSDFAVLDADQSLVRHAKKGGAVGHEFRHLLGAHDTLPGVFRACQMALRRLSTSSASTAGRTEAAARRP